MEIPGHFDDEMIRIENLGCDMIDLVVIVDDEALSIRLGQTERQELIEALKEVTIP